jgi:hypothetical protein
VLFTDHGTQITSHGLSSFLPSVAGRRVLSHLVNLVEELGASLGEFFSAATLEFAEEDISFGLGFHVAAPPN